MFKTIKKPILPLVLTAALLLCLTACGENVQITETAAKAAQTELYECDDFSITIPNCEEGKAGWQYNCYTWEMQCVQFWRTLQ